MDTFGKTLATIGAAWLCLLFAFLLFDYVQNVFNREWNLSRSMSEIETDYRNRGPSLERTEPPRGHLRKFRETGCGRAQIWLSGVSIKGTA